ncbi:hypothetical protein GALMADRAFT_133924 [Galerina marginata CBS 339.88]|uniref:Uncharacterized protein n=1 Tax=Galerina marginata (strain CBS 339.88) TaxID=685588 RepID=A0A067TNC4_GALM3|nr:hypothetical protein GALMADRAFT_133924 [Galerina marginata CBS 339.88]
MNLSAEIPKPGESMSVWQEKRLRTDDRMIGNLPSKLGTSKADIFDLKDGDTPSSLTAIVLICLLYFLGGPSLYAAFGLLGYSLKTTKYYIVAGTGCPPGTASATISATGQSLSLKYTTFQANAGPGFGFSDNRKNCQATLVVQVPTGYQFALNRFTYNSQYALDYGVAATYTTTYYFQSSLSEGIAGGNITGPAASRSRNLSNPSSPAVWSSCGETSLVNINTAVRVSNSANADNSGHVLVVTKSDVAYVILPYSSISLS